jgi:hypothetical protein
MGGRFSSSLLPVRPVRLLVNGGVQRYGRIPSGVRPCNLSLFLMIFPLASPKRRAPGILSPIRGCREENRAFPGTHLALS